MKTANQSSTHTKDSDTHATTESSHILNTLIQSHFSKRLATVRISFGIVWAIDAAFKFEPAFYRSILSSIQGADIGEPSWLNRWFHAWYHLIGISPQFFAVLTIVIEVLITVCLLLGFARRLNYVAGAVFSFLIWSVAEGFGGPYVAGSTDIGAGFIYVIAFALLYVGDSLVVPSWSLDPLIEQHISWWHHLAEPQNRLK